MDKFWPTAGLRRTYVVKPSEPRRFRVDVTLYKLFQVRCVIDPDPAPYAASRGQGAEVRNRSMIRTADSRADSGMRSSVPWNIA